MASSIETSVSTTTSSKKRPLNAVLDASGREMSKLAANDSFCSHPNLLLDMNDVLSHR